MKTSHVGTGETKSVQTAFFIKPINFGPLDFLNSKLVYDYSTSILLRTFQGLKDKAGSYRCFLCSDFVKKPWLNQMVTICGHLIFRSLYFSINDVFPTKTLPQNYRKTRSTLFFLQLGFFVAGLEYVGGASKIKLKKVNKKQTVTVRRVIIILNI